MATTATPRERISESLRRRGTASAQRVARDTSYTLYLVVAELTELVKAGDVVRHDDGTFALAGDRPTL